MEDNEYCDECRFLLEKGDLFKQGFIRCVPCGAKCCSRECLVEHRIYCPAVRERRVRRS